MLPVSSTKQLVSKDEPTSKPLVPKSQYDVVSLAGGPSRRSMLKEISLDESIHRVQSTRDSLDIEWGHLLLSRLLPVIEISEKSTLIQEDEHSHCAPSHAEFGSV